MARVGLDVPAGERSSGGRTRLVWTGTAEGAYGDLLVDPSGMWTYTLDPSLDATRGLSEGQVAVERFTAAVTDSAGAASSYEIVVEVVGSAAFGY